MKLQSRSKEAPEINLTSLIDVVLLLLVFFMVSTSFVRDAEITLRLPQAEASTSPNTLDEVLDITVTQTGWTSRLPRRVAIS
jgi:biopolymer transport protein ExbD